jgi:uncharacterized membrane protein YsdA (DUF1294 family)
VVAVTFIEIILSIMILLNVYSFLLFRSDKKRAEKGEWRTSEAKLLVAALFGPLGGYWSMKRYRHKTRKLKFVLVPMFLLLEIVLIAYIIWKYYLPI